MKRVCFALLLLLLTPCLIEAQDKLQLNTGFKAGVQASTYQQTEFTLEG